MVIKAGVVAAIAGVFALSSVPPAQAAAVVGVATGEGAAATSASSTAIVSWDGTTETIEVSLGLKSASGTIGLLLPTPSKAVVSAGDPTLFVSAASAIAPVQHQEDDWWGRAAPAVVHAPAVQPSPIGSVEPTTIRATDRSRLSKWLKKYQLKLSADDRTQLAQYASDGWSLSLIAVDAATAVDGPLDPVQMRFATKKPILPMRFAASGKTATSVRIYSVGDHRSALRIAGSTRNLNAAQSVVWAGPTVAPKLRELGDYLTVTDVRFDSPDAQVTGDIGIVDAQADDTLIPAAVVYRPIALLGFPLGWLLVVWGGVGALLAVGYLVNRFRSQ